MIHLVHLFSISSLGVLNAYVESVFLYPYTEQTLPEIQYFLRGLRKWFIYVSASDVLDFQSIQRISRLPKSMTALALCSLHLSILGYTVPNPIITNTIISPGAST